MSARKLNRKLPFEYPATQPEWLLEWPDDQAIREMFAPGLRRYAAEIIRKSRSIRVQWNDDSLTVHVGNQRAVWRLVKGEWRRNCSCGYKNDRCVHAYAAARIFGQISDTENLLRGHAPADTAPRPAAPRKRIAGDKSAEQLELGSHYLQTVASDPKKLEIEVDFHHQPGKVALRFYVFAGDRRQLLRLQQIYNLALRIKHSSHDRHSEWQDADRRFLKWLADRLRGKPEVRQNLNLLKLNKKQFDAWQSAWADTPGRFIERATQEVLGAKRVQTGMHVELSFRDDEKVEIALLVTAPDGQRFPYHEVYQKLVSGTGEALMNGQQLVVNAPFSRSLLQEVFSKKQPLMPRDKVCEYLPALLENRLDLVFGPAVEHRECEGECHAYAEADGANILLSFRVGDASLHPDTMKAAGKIEEAGNKFIIWNHVAPGLSALRDFVNELTAEKASGDKLRVPGRSEAVAALARQWRVLPNSIHRHAAPQLHPLLEKPLELTPEISCRPHGTFVDLTLAWRSGSIDMSHTELEGAVNRKQPVVRTAGGIWAMLDLDTAAQRLEAVKNAGMSSHARRFKPEAQALIETCLNEAGAVFAETSKSIGEALAKQEFPPAPQLPAKLRGVLRHYQEDGFTFLSDRSRYGLGAILADDMGLGKTLQILAFLAGRRQGHEAGKPRPSPSLVVCPASVAGVWQNESEKFPLGLSARIYAGKPAEREEILHDPDADLFIVNYALLRTDANAFQAHTFDVIILDEAQYIKNPAAQITRTVKKIEAGQRLALTGTPLENRALDLWSIMDFLNPGFLSSIKDFSETFENNSGTGENLGHRIAPVMLRRTKQEVAPELPPRTEETITVELTTTQERMYKKKLAEAQESLREKGPVEILAALTRLRQICCHPGLIDETCGAGDSAKLQTLCEMLEEITSEGHSALVFSQFASVLNHIDAALRENGLDTLTITGRTPTKDRHALTRMFTESPDPQVFLLSLKAAGTGLTLTKADYVFLFDPWWNPAVERQAIDRTHRIGQDKPVMAYRLVAAGTIEENVIKLQKQKAELFDEVMQEATGRSIAAKLTAADLRNLLATEALSS